MVYNSFCQLIGKTPMLYLENIKKKYNLSANIIAKLEYLNPAGSTKDRAAASMIDDAIKSGKLKEGGTVIEATSGNTGIGLAAVCASRGISAIIVMPSTASKERVSIMRALGAEVILTDGTLGMAGAISKAEELERNIEGSIIARQFENKANPKAHFEGTAPEIYADMDGKIDFFVAGIGTGGTITGCGEYFKSKNENIRVVGVEPASSPYLTKGVSGAHALQGIGAGFVPEILNLEVIDEILCVSDSDGFEYAKALAKCEGILCGITSGAALAAAIELAKREENIGKNIVVLLPDSADRYYSTEMFEE